MIKHYIKNYQIILCFFAKLFRCGVVSDIHIQHYPTYQIQLRMNSATMAAAPQPTAANPATPTAAASANTKMLILVPTYILKLPEATLVELPVIWIRTIHASVILVALWGCLELNLLI